MLVLSRKPGQSVDLPALGITVTLLEIRGKAVRLGITAPPEIGICRTELLEELERQQQLELQCGKEAAA
ncbi:MAG: hypothetical protein Fues2KO_45520 [Fuerstiella sp.]